jgi:8-oxo-dGTP pyrophosphatase MutT (NUDIX family)
MSPEEQLLCDSSLKSRIAANLRRFTVQQCTQSGSRAAAVALTVVDFACDAGVYGMCTRGIPGNAAALILTFRAGGLRKHASQWALPGGRIEPGEEPEDAALRELSEEAGLMLGRESVLGRLDDFSTRSGYVITPVVVWAGPGVVLKPNPAEVESIHRIPLAEFMRPDAPILEETGDSSRPLLLMPVGSSWIAAPTAALLYQFREAAIRGLPTRVAHFEQPSFAWR